MRLKLTCSKKDCHYRNVLINGMRLSLFLTEKRDDLVRVH